MTETGRKSARRRDYYCSFCDKSQDTVKQLIAGPRGVYICNECVDLCYGIVHEEENFVEWSESHEKDEQHRAPGRLGQRRKE